MDAVTVGYECRWRWPLPSGGQWLGIGWAPGGGGGGVGTSPPSNASLPWALPQSPQVADELREAIPDVLKDHELYQVWGYKYVNQNSGISIHADAAAVNVNFWLTPDDCNLAKGTGGLVVYNLEAPANMSFAEYNGGAREAYLEQIAQGGREKIVIPYRQNRVVIFHSNLYHETDSYKFKPTYECHRINFTMLFGKRLTEA